MFRLAAGITNLRPIIVWCFCLTPIAKGYTQSLHLKDTIYYLSFLDLAEKDGADPKWIGRYVNRYDLLPEKEIMNKVIRKKLGHHYTLIALPDSCYNSMKADSVFRRKIEFAQAACRKCAIRQRVILLDAVWEILDKDAMWYVRFRTRSGITRNPWIIGTWWNVHAMIYSPQENNFLIHVRRNYNQFNDCKPVKWWPGIGHVRFFKRPIRRVKKFLLTNNNARH